MGWGGDDVSVCGCVDEGWTWRKMYHRKKLKYKNGMAEKHTVPNQLHII